MELKKEIVSDLKKYNKELEKHLKGLDFTYLEKTNLIKNESKEEEFFGLLASNIMDLRTEFALMRKNLSVEIEGMVIKTISEQQKAFINETNKLYSGIMMDLKNNFASYINDINENLIKLRKEFNNSKENEGKIENRLVNIESNILEYKNMLNNIDLNIKLNGDLTRSLNNHLNEKHYNIEEFRKEFKNISSNIIKLKEGRLKSDLNFIENNEILLSKKLDDINKRITKKDIDKKEKVIIVEEHDIIKDSIKSEENRRNIDKLIDIDAKLSKLDSLR